MPSRLKNQRNGRCVNPIEIFGVGQAIDLGTPHEFRATAIDHVAKICVIAAVVVVPREAGRTLAAGYAGSQHDFLPDVDDMDFRANFSNFPGNITAGNVRKRNGYARQAPPHPQVEVVQGAGMDTNQNFVGAKVRLIHIRIVENTGITMLMENDRFHKPPPGKECTEQERLADISCHDMLEAPDRSVP